MLNIHSSFFLEKDCKLKAYRTELLSNNTPDPITISDSKGFSFSISEDQAKDLVAGILKILEEK